MRKILIAIAALAVAGTAVSFVSVAPASATHWQNRHYQRHHWRPSVRYFAPPVYNSCYVRRVIPTVFRPRVEWVNRCY